MRPSKYLPVKNQQLQHLRMVLNMFKVNNKNTGTNKAEIPKRKLLHFSVLHMKIFLHKVTLHKKLSFP